jgi:anaerobic dimethyl sulfoxide reductase subunit B (iron-sulfur subunit)
MARNGLLIQQEWCTGCHACEVACKQEHAYPVGVCGVRVDEVIMNGQDKVSVDFAPVITRYCDLCANRTKTGEDPACVKHCQATCMAYGKISDLAKAQEKQPGSSLWTPQ